MKQLKRGQNRNKEMHSDLGSRLRKLRKELGFSVTELAKEVGVTRGLISQVENGRANPSLTTLRRIAEVLCIPLFYLFISGDKDLRVKRSGERLELHTQNGEVEYEFVSDSRKGQMEFTLARAKPGSSSGKELDRHSGHEALLVLEGRMTLEVENKTYELCRMDSIIFDAISAHRWTNAGDSDLCFISVTSLPILQC